MPRVRASVGKTDLFAHDQQTDFDLQSKFFVDFPSHRVSRLFTLLNPATWQPPRIVRPKHMFDEEHAAIRIEDNTDRADWLPWRFESRHQAERQA